MCVKAACFFFLLILCFFMHAASASSTPSSSLPNTVSHSTSILHTQKVENKHYKLKKFGLNGRVLSKSGSICNKYNYKPIKEGTSGGADCKSSHDKAPQLQFTKSQDSRWPHLNNVKEMDSQYSSSSSSSISTQENLSETMDYQTPHQKSPIHN